MADVKPWDELSRAVAFETNWFDVLQSNLVLPDGSVGRGWYWILFAAPAVGIIPVSESGNLLLVDQYRFTTRTRGWEIPAGRVEPGEDLIDAAARELREETGHVAEQYEELGRYFPSNGSSNQEFVLFVARGVVQRGEIEHTNEVEAARWFTPAEVRALVARDEIRDGMSLTGLLWYFFREKD